MASMHLLSTPRRLSTPLSHKPISRSRRSRHRRSRHGLISVRAAATSSSPAVPSFSVDSVNPKRLKSVLPGGTWWRLEEEDEKGERSDVAKKSVGLSVVTALKRMWVLVAEDRWVVFIGFASLLGAAVIFELLNAI